MNTAVGNATTRALPLPEANAMRRRYNSTSAVCSPQARYACPGRAMNSSRAPTSVPGDSGFMPLPRPKREPEQIPGEEDDDPRDRGYHRVRQHQRHDGPHAGALLVHARKPTDQSEMGQQRVDDV